MRAAFAGFLGLGFALLLALLVSRSEALGLLLATDLVALAGLLIAYVAFLKPRRTEVSEPPADPRS